MCAFCVRNKNKKCLGCYTIDSSAIFHRTYKLTLTPTVVQRGELLEPLACFFLHRLHNSEHALQDDTIFVGNDVIP